MRVIIVAARSPFKQLSLANACFAPTSRASADRTRQAPTNCPSHRLLLLFSFVLWCAVCNMRSSLAQTDDRPAPSDALADEFFEKQIRPLLAARCFECHGPEKQKNGLRLDTRASAIEGGDTGPAVIPGKPGESLLIQVIHYDDVLKMPPKSKLPEAEIAALEKWISLGAPWPASHATDASDPTTGDKDGLAIDIKARALHWSFQPIQVGAPPPVRDPDWPLSPVDCFLLKKLETLGLHSAPEADRRTLIRRLSFDLIGLPPAPEEIESFVADERPDAYERLVDRLLASPHYGERWGRHWLDLVRFAETSGHEFDYDIPFAWRYRDYVIRAWNADVPYDAFVTEHIAGDLLPNPRREPTSGLNESVVGTAFYFFGDGAQSPVDLRDEQLRRTENQIDVLGKTFLALTVACARCHDHKFDPITNRDYYALAGFAKSSRYQLAFLDPPEQTGALARKLRESARQLALAMDAPRPRQLAATDTAGGEIFETFDGDNFEQWSVTGPAFGHAPSQDGDACIFPEGTVRTVSPGIAHSALSSQQLQGVLRSRTFTIEHKFMHYLAAGRKSRIQLVIDGFEKIRDPIYGELTKRVDLGDEFQWVTQDVSMWIGHRAYVELADGAIPEFTGSETLIAPGDGYLAVAEIRCSDGPPPPAPSDLLGLARAQADRSAPDLNERWAKHRALEAQIKPPALSIALADGSGENELLLPRGNSRAPGALVPRRFLEVFCDPSAPVSPEGSGRHELARTLLDPANPLPPRVLVNRLWHYHFGRGLVATPDDFGRMGQAPTHPELLDWLAAEFVRSGCSIKHMHRLIVQSRAYRMTSYENEAPAVDPDNRWLHRANLRRLEAETLRDAMLAVSGRLERSLYGPGAPPHLTPFMDGRGKPASSGPLDGNGRRTIYLTLRRNFLSPLLLAFDFPPQATTMGRRNVSNVPAQALALLNDPFVIDQARYWAESTLQSSGHDTLEGIDRMYLCALGRAANDAERGWALKLLGPGGQAGELDAWADLAHVLFNMKEFLFIP